VGSPLQHGIFRLLIRLGAPAAARLLLVPVALWYALFRPSVRRRSHPYLSRRFPRHGPLARRIDAYRLFRGLGEALVDRAVLGIAGPGALTPRSEGRESLASLLAEGKGLVLVTAHVGCWQAAMASLASLGTPVNLLLHREEGDVDRHLSDYGGGFAFRAVDPAGPYGGTLELLGFLKEKQVVCIMGDRVMGGRRSSVAAEFLGGRARFPVAPYRLASATGAPVAVIFPYRDDTGRHALELAEVLRVPPERGRRPEAYLPEVGRFVRALEDFVSRRPYQYFNFFDIWKGPTEPHP
jgi:predicted LPLAT superfamily acyltransferase